MRAVFLQMASLHQHSFDPSAANLLFPTTASLPADHLPIIPLPNPPEPEALGYLYESILDPRAERRAMGAHYTPRELAAQIINETLLLQEDLHPSDILSLQICDPAMGTGVFLLETCRALAHALRLAWQRHPKDKPALSPDESEDIAALRLIAQHCLHGIDKNPMAVSLARASLWLLTRAKQSPATFLEASFRAGDALTMPWEDAFPSVFQRQNPGFDAVIGNPPFLGGSKISSVHGPDYLAQLLKMYPGAHGNGDLAAYFFRRAFQYLRTGGKSGLIATNTIAQGDTRTTGLAWICSHGGSIYNATRRLRWPGHAQVIVSVVYVSKGQAPVPPRLDDQEVGHISAFLQHGTESSAPSRLPENKHKSFLGAKVYGRGFLFQDSHPQSSPIALMHRILERDPSQKQLIFPYLGGHEINADPHRRPVRHVIHFGLMSEAEASKHSDLFAIVRAKVKPEREKLSDNPDGRHRKRFWWQWGRDTPGLFSAIKSLKRVLICSRIQPHWCISFVDTGPVFSESTVVFALDTYSAFAVLQSRVHEAFARRMGSSMKDDLRYTPSDCFEPFPFPNPSGALESLGAEYHEYRETLMIKYQQGLTAVYNRFHDPKDQTPELQTLRRLHGRLDRATFDAYHWTDLSPQCEFLPDSRANHGSKTIYRYQWPNALCDEVLQRLLELNRARNPGPGIPAALGKKNKKTHQKSLYTRRPQALP